MSAALAAATNVPAPHLASAKPPKKTLRSSLQETLRSAAGHVRQNRGTNSVNPAELGTLKDSSPSRLLSTADDDATATTRTRNNDPRSPSRTTMNSTTSPSAEDTKTARGGGFLKLLSAKPRLTSANLRGAAERDRQRDRDAGADRDKTYRAFQAPTLRSGTLSDPALHTLARREKHAPLLSLAAAFDPHTTSTFSTSSAASRDTAAPPARGAASPTPSSSTRPTNASTTSLASRTRSTSKSRPPTAGTPSVSAPKPLQASPSSKRPPPVSGLSRSRLTSPSTPSLVPSSTEPGTVSRGTTPTPAVGPPTIRKRSSLRTSAEGGKAGPLAGTASSPSSGDAGTITARKLSTSSNVPAAASSSSSSAAAPASPSRMMSRTTSSPATASRTRPPTLTSSSTSNLPLPPASPSRSTSPTSQTPSTAARRRNSSSLLPPSNTGTAARGKSPSPTPANLSPPPKMERSEKRRSTTPTPATTPGARPVSPSTPTIRDRARVSSPSPSPSTPASARRGSQPTAPASSSSSPSRARHVPSPLVLSPREGLKSPTASEMMTNTRGAIRLAASFILTQASSPPSELLTSSPLLGRQWLDEMEYRTRGLERASKAWRLYSDEFEREKGADERERQVFCEALRDGYVLCQLLNKWQPNVVSRIDHREDGITKATNIANFAIAARKVLVDESSGSEVTLCTHEDFLTCSAASMMRVAQTVLSLSRFVEANGGGSRSTSTTPSPPPPISSSPPQIMHTRPSAFASSPPPTPSRLTSAANASSSDLTSTSWIDPNTQVWAGSPAQQAALRGSTAVGRQRRSNNGPSASTPNLLIPPTASPPSVAARGGSKRESPIASVPILTGRRGSTGAAANSPASASASAAMMPSISTPARTPASSTASQSSSAAPKHASLPPPSPSSQAPPPARSSGTRHPPTSGNPHANAVSNRSSFASTATSATGTSATDSLFESDNHYHYGGARSSGGGAGGGRYDKFGSVRTNVTNLTSVTVPSSGGIPSLSRSEARDVVKEMEEMEGLGLEERWNNSSETVHNLSVPSGGRRDRRSSEAASDLVRVLEEDEAPQNGRRLRNLIIPSTAMGPPSSRQAVFPNRGSPTKPSPMTTNVESEDVFAFDDDGLLPPPSASRERARAYSPSYASRGSPIKRDQWLDQGDASPSPVRIGGGSSGLSSSPSRRPSGRLVPKGSSISNSSAHNREGGYFAVRNRVSGEMSHANDSTSSLVESPIAVSPLLPASSGSAVPIPFPRRQSNEFMRAGGKPALGRSFSVSASPSKPSQTTESPSKQPAPRPLGPRSRILSDSTADGSQRINLDRALSDGGNDVKAGRRTRFESMVDISSSANGIGREANAPSSAPRRTLIVKEEGQPAVQYQLGNCIGRGQFGSVYRALNMTTGQVVAVKQISLAGLPENEVMQLMHEVELLKRLDHPSIVKYEGMCKDDDSLNIILEYVENGSLGQTLKAFGRLNERLVAGYVAKILEGLHYLHQSQVVHCDMKAANILTTKNGNVKLSDFGVSLNLRAMEQIKNDVAGTPNWMAPEVIELQGASTASDIWSLGCTVIELLTGKPPYADIQNGLSVMFRIVEDVGPPLPDNLSEPLRDFFDQCFNKDPTKRPSAEKLFEHPWLKDTWVELKDLRPQDSIPFLRRVSTDLQKRQSLAHQISFVQPAPPNKESSPADGSPSEEEEASPPRQHTFVKTSFSQPVDCRICWTQVRKSAMFCQSCNLVCHSRCVDDAPSSCDLLQQVRAYTEHTRQAASSPTPSEPRGRKLSTVKRTSNPGTSQAASPSSAPPTSYPYSVMTTGWRKIRNSTSSMASSDVGGLASSVPTTPRVSEEHEREAEPVAKSNHARLATGDSSLRSSGSGTGSSSSGTRSSSSGIRSEGSRISPDGVTRAMSPSVTVSSSQAPSAVDENSLPRRTPAPETNQGTQSNRLKRKQKDSGSGAGCLVQ